MIYIAGTFINDGVKNGKNFIRRFIECGCFLFGSG